ncbi:mavicyanin [Salvia miltiorrhiza]|uniref:mavicyanin n=1 Tax=Salvia miltiorrhiza TaxID=226208 RepID=UPI0025ABB63C|nr:mavicyanin [Salvia miltiorrhiza]
MVNSCRLIAVVIATVFLRQALAAKHSVGGSQGWDESADFDSWASAQTFKVGDELEFKYSQLHSVAELPNESAFKNCDISVASNSLNDGDSKVKLTKPGTRYFACGTSGHCEQGMKVKITTVAADASPSSPTGASTTPAATTQSSSAAPRHQLLNFFALMLFIAIFV